MPKWDLDIDVMRPDVAACLVNAYNAIWPLGFLGLKLQVERDVFRRQFLLFAWSSWYLLNEEEAMNEVDAADALSGVVWLDAMRRLGSKVCGELQGRAALELRDEVLLGLARYELPACLQPIFE